VGRPRDREKKEVGMMATMGDVAAKLFNGRYTIESTRTNEHRTIWVQTEVYPEGACRTVSLLTGTENDNPDHYTLFGFASDAGIEVLTSKRGADKLFETYAHMLWTLWLDGAFSPWAKLGYKIHLEGRCLKCNRPLTTPESIRRGIGPICAEGGF
jgi:hypothetical protein